MFFKDSKTNINGSKTVNSLNINSYNSLQYGEFPQNHDSLLPFTLFSSNQTLENYIKKYPFCYYLEYGTGYYPEIQEGNSAVFLLMYSDLVEMSKMLLDLLEQYPGAFFLFIPPLFVREAFEEIQAIFERHIKRTDPIINPIQFVTTMQLTISKNLGVPIPLIGPIK